MRNRSLWVSAAWPYLAAAAVLAILAGLVFIRPVYQRMILGQDLARAARMMQIGYASHIELDAFTNFTWTTLHVFEPYSSAKTIEDALGRDWNGSEDIHKSDSITLLVFMNGERITRWIEVDRGVMDFAGVVAESPFTPETALFIMPVEGEPQLVILQ